MKKIGIIGGTTPESTCYYYRLYMEISRKRLGNHVYPPLIVYSINFSEFMNNQDGWEGRKRMLVQVGEALNRAGADIIALSANTPHIVFDDLQSQLDVQMVSILDALVERMKMEHVMKPLLLGTRTTMSADFYRNRLLKEGFDVVVPSEEEQYRLNDIIFQEIAKGDLSSRDWILQMINKYAVNEGVDSIILGCTELPLILQEGDVPLKVFDTARIHMEKLIEIATS